MASTQAPGRLELVRSFVNTIEPEDELDLLGTNGDLEKWCAETGFCAAPDDETLASLRAFREGLRALLEANAGEGEETERWRALQPYAAESCYRLSVTPEGRPALLAQGSGAGRAIAELFAIIYDAIGAGTWPRLKACRKHTCRWAFYDRSKNGSGAWCTMKVCGNRAKAERRRARQKAD